MLEIALDLNARLETLDSHIPSHFSTFEEHSPLPLWCVIVAYLAKLIKRFLSKNKEMPVARHLLRRYTIILQLFLLFRKIFVKLSEDIVVWVQSITLLCIAEFFVCSCVYLYKFVYSQNVYEFKISINYFILYLQ